ncbi:MAG TPA: transcriptional coactivator p15/PC4 family protein [Longimicrobiales bacterium]|nr:transcriptional coactivator p15/PC4 family protein [Longimicrobiales bacterium]
MEDTSKISKAKAPVKGRDYLTLPLGRGGELRVTRSTFRGAERIDVRMYVPYQDGELGPTRKGVSVRVEDLPRLRDALQRAELEAWSEELLDPLADYADHNLEPPAS